MIILTVFSVRIPEDLKQKMDELSNINWSEEVRIFLRNRVHDAMTHRRIDPVRLEMAMKSTDELRKIHPAEQNWNSTEELSKWRNRHK